MLRIAVVAQLVEHIFAKDEVEGAEPSGRSMKTNQLLDLLFAISKQKPSRVKDDGTKCWKFKGHTIEVGPAAFDTHDFTPKRKVMIDGKSVVVNWEKIADYRDAVQKMKKMW